MFKKILMAAIIATPLLISSIASAEQLTKIDKTALKIQYYQDQLTLEGENHDLRIEKIEEFYDLSMEALLGFKESDFDREDRLNKLNRSKGVKSESERHANKVAELTTYYQSRETVITQLYEDKKNKKIAENAITVTRLETLITKLETMKESLEDAVDAIEDSQSN